MRKQEFLAELEYGLEGLPREEIDERLDFYSEMIDDRMEEGFSEEDAVAGIGSLNDVIAQIIDDVPLSRILKNDKPRRARRGWEIALIILGFPVWFPLLISVGVILLSLYLVIWALVISLWGIEISLWGCVIGGIGLAIVHVTQGNYLPALAMLGVGLFSAGLSILLFYACIAATRGTARLAKKTVLGFKTRSNRKEIA